jgi:RimJ/RimL family protein N-acetyltransferase
VIPISVASLHVRHVLAGEHDRLRELRLRALASDPEAFGSTYAREAARTTRWWQRWAARSALGLTQRTFVLEDNDRRWLGLALVRLDSQRPNAAVLNAMWVAPEARGRRASGLLCQACATWAAARGCRELTLAVVIDNHAARRAYEAAGFAVCGEVSWERDGRTVEELVMSRSLQGASAPRKERQANTCDT